MAMLAMECFVLQHVPTRSSYSGETASLDNGFSPFLDKITSTVPYLEVIVFLSKISTVY